MSVHRVWVKLYRHHVVLFTTSFPHQTKTKKAVFMITLWSNVHVAMLSHDVVSTIWEWVQSGNESSLGMSSVWEWVQSGNESSLGMSPDTDTEWTHILPWFLVTLRLPVFLLSHPHLSTCLDLQCPLGTSWPGLPDESLIATTGNWWLVATMKLTYWFTPAGPVWAYIVSLPYSLIPRLSHITLLVVLKCTYHCMLSSPALSVG